MNDDRAAFYESLFRVAASTTEGELIWAIARDNREEDAAACGLMAATYAKTEEA